MAFGRKKTPEPPVEQVGWADARRIVRGTLERPVTRKRHTAVHGPEALRVPLPPDGEAEIFAPCAYVAGAEALPALGTSTAYAAFLDPALSRLLLTVGRPEADGDDLVHTVRDDAGAELGTVRRVAGKGRRRPSWRIGRPGLPAVTGKADVDEVGAAGRLLLKGVDATLGVLDMAFRGGESAPDPKKPRFLVWRPEAEPGTTGVPEKIMDSRGGQEFTFHTADFDRRLAFAVALKGDTPTAG